MAKPKLKYCKKCKRKWPYPNGFCGVCEAGGSNDERDLAARLEEHEKLQVVKRSRPKDPKD